jgi:isopentenyl phosphate kinase
VTPFGFFPSEEEQKRALKEFRLQQKTQLVDNRIELYICESCGDISCGSITAKIIDSGDKIIWTHFASQSNPDEIGEEIQVEGIEFERQNYFKAFATLG